MSTRAYIRIEKEGSRAVHFHHHSDGYPAGVGQELIRWLREYTGEWEPSAIGEYINSKDDDYCFIDSGPAWDHEYVYVVDCDKKRMRCYYKGICDDFEETEAEPIEIAPCIFGGNVDLNSSRHPDWDAFRREAAKDILCALVIHCSLSGKDCSKIAIEYADELIKLLKEDQK